MRFNRLTSLALCLGVVFLLMVGSAFAGTTKFNNGNALKYAKELGAINGAYALPTKDVTRTLNVIRATGQNFFIDAILDNGARWKAGITTGATTQVAKTTGSATYTVQNITATGTTATWLVTITAPAEDQYPQFAFHLAGVTVEDRNNIIGTTGTINLTFQTRDSATGVVIDSGTEQVPFMKGAYGVTIDKVNAGKKTIDVGADPSRSLFVGGTDVDGTASVESTSDWTAELVDVAVLNASGTQFKLASVDTLDFIITGDLSGITYVQLGAHAAVKVTATDLAAGSLKISVAGDTLQPTETFFIHVIGNVALNTRSLNLTVNLNMVTVDAHGDTNANDRNLVSNELLTTWDLNGTVLVAQWVNGNNAALNSRIYLWNRSSVSGMVTVDVYTLPNSTAGSTKLGSIDYGTLAGSSSVNLKLAEDILNPIGVTLPYTDNGGNLTVVVTIRATGVTGISQTFSSGFAYGAYVLSAGN